MNLLISLLFALLPSLVLAQVVSVEFKEKGFLFSNEPTLTFVWPSPQAKTTLIFIPGGEGRIGLTPERKNIGGFYAATLKPLSDVKLTSGTFNVVLFDSPVNLPVGSGYAHSRQGAEHLLRIESVVRHYKELYGQPVWLMGHSNGAASITEFYKMLQKKQQEQIVEGAIYSSARNGSSFNDITKLPILFLVHEKDGCPVSSPSVSRTVFEQQQKTNPMRTEYHVVKGGEAQAQHVCTSGFHMFYGAADEAYSAIDRFVQDDKK